MGAREIPPHITVDLTSLQSDIYRADYGIQVHGNNLTRNVWLYTQQAEGAGRQRLPNGCVWLF